MVAAHGARFHLAEVGRGPLVLLLHGFPEFWWAWRHQLVTLAAAGYRAAAMDLRGYGASDKPPRGYDPFTLAGDVAGVVRSLGEPGAVLVGHGWGAFLAWSTATLHPDVVRAVCVSSMPHPRRLRRALTTDPGQVLASRHVLGFQAPVLPERRLLAHDAALVAGILGAWAAPGWPDDATAARYRQAFRIPGVAHCSLEYHRWAVRSIPRPDGLRFNARMKTPVRAPTLHLHGRLDSSLLARSAAGSGAYVAAPYVWRVLEGVGHFPHEEAPECFEEELLGWLTRAVPPALRLRRQRARRDRDMTGRARNARPRDAAGRPLARGAVGADRVPDDLVLPPRAALAEAQRLLDAGLPFPAHDVLEGTWKASPADERALWQGLAQVAVGLTHLQRGNAAGAAALLRRGAERVRGYADDPPYGLDAAGVSAYAEALADVVTASGLPAEAPPPPQLTGGGGPSATDST